MIKLYTQDKISQQLQWSHTAWLGANHTPVYTVHICLNLQPVLKAARSHSSFTQTTNFLLLLILLHLYRINADILLTTMYYFNYYFSLRNIHVACNIKLRIQLSNKPRLAAVPPTPKPWCRAKVPCILFFPLSAK